MRQRLQKMGPPSFEADGAAEPLRTSWRHETLRRNLLLVMLCIALAPLAVAGSVGYFQYRALIHRQEMKDLSAHAERTVHSLELYLDGLKHDIIVVTSSYTAAELSRKQVLDEALSRLRNKHPSIVDLSVIDPRGVQIAYAGPYALAGKEYSESPWYERTLARKVHVSEVFLGFRNVPHFVIAASRKEPASGGFWVVRASIDAETLDRFLAALSTEAVDDIFLVSDGTLQTSSRFYGNVPAPVTLASPPGKKGIEVTEVARGSDAILRATAVVQNTPWILVLEQNSDAESRLWAVFRTNLLAVSLITAVFAGLVMVTVAKSLADRIHDAEEARESLIKESEHTSKLASVGRLAAGVAHEINNPLAIIAEKAGLMKDILTGAPDVPLRKKFMAELTSLEEAVNRARVITHRLLGFARRMDVHLEPIQVNDVLREVIGFLDKEAMYRAIRIEQDLDPHLPVIKSDTGQLQQIFLNLLNNAIDAVDRGGAIRITSRKTESGDAVAFDVKDDGPGMPPEVQRKIFEPFFTTKRGADRRGTGLGLSITYGLVKRLGGHIGVQSAVGSGTVFRVTFPLPPEEAQEAGDA